MATGCTKFSAKTLYDETFDGVLLAYSASTKNELGKILPGLNPYFGVKTQAQLLLFYPKPDMLLEGKVVKLGEHSIHIIVLGFSSATIIEEDIREEFTHKVKHGEEVYASTVNRRHKIEVGTIKLLVGMMNNFRRGRIEEKDVKADNRQCVSRTRIHYLVKTDHKNHESLRAQARKDKLPQT
ncbi:hypothetical protein CTI12_AA361610 [Artemisia annua]|uniref:DNA-directed RNA polymerase subunit n=1 Tax=Artemisia annua TaxID=35608 RepID=A0A2U1MN78_ARTAN|nr:hypothetical protein CTI12_AA361610 [Artemisia annua]